jgi:hypothetical protein
MLFSGIEYSVVQGIEQRFWKNWPRLNIREGSTRGEAIEKAEKAIGKQRH